MEMDSNRWIRMGLSINRGKSLPFNLHLSPVIENLSFSLSWVVIAIVSRSRLPRVATPENHKQARQMAITFPSPIHLPTSLPPITSYRLVASDKLKNADSRRRPLIGAAVATHIFSVGFSSRFQLSTINVGQYHYAPVKVTIHQIAKLPIFGKSYSLWFIAYSSTK